MLQLPISFVKIRKFGSDNDNRVNLRGTDHTFMIITCVFWPSIVPSQSVEFKIYNNIRIINSRKEYHGMSAPSFSCSHFLSVFLYLALSLNCPVILYFQMLRIDYFIHVYTYIFVTLPRSNWESHQFSAMKIEINFSFVFLVQRNPRPIYLGLVKWVSPVWTVPPFPRAPRFTLCTHLMHISSRCYFTCSTTVSSISVTRSAKINNNFKTLCIYATNATRSGHRSTCPPPPWVGLPHMPRWWRCWGRRPARGFVINHFRAAMPQNDTRPDSGRFDPVRPLASSRCRHHPNAPSPHSPAHTTPSPLTSRVVCTFWRSQIVLLPRIQQIGKCSQVAAARATEIPTQPSSWRLLSSLIGGVARCRPVALSPCRCPQPFNNKNLNKTFGAAF